MDHRSKFAVEPGAKVRLSKIDASYTGKHETHEKALPEIQKHVERIDKLQYLLYADGNQSLLVVLQALDAAGKDGTIRHVFSGMNPQGTFVFGFKQPSKEEPRTTSYGAPIYAHQEKAKWCSSIDRTTRMSSWCACTSWCRIQCGRNDTT